MTSANDTASELRCTERGKNGDVKKSSAQLFFKIYQMLFLVVDAIMTDKGSVFNKKREIFCTKTHVNSDYTESRESFAYCEKSVRNVSRPKTICATNSFHRKHGIIYHQVNLLQGHWCNSGFASSFTLGWF